MRGRQILYPNMEHDSNRRPPLPSDPRTAGAGPEGNRHEPPLRISAPPAIMCMYTDWGNLKVVSCVAWRNGTDPAAQRCTGNGRIGGVHFQAKRQPGTR